MAIVEGLLPSKFENRVEYLCMIVLKRRRSALGGARGCLEDAVRLQLIERQFTVSPKHLLSPLLFSLLTPAAFRGGEGVLSL